MKTWKEKVLIPKTYRGSLVRPSAVGICTVKEASDKETTEKIAPVSMGFVNLYKGRKWVGYCGIFFAEKRKIK